YGNRTQSAMDNTVGATTPDQETFTFTILPNTTKYIVQPIAQVQDYLGLGTTGALQANWTTYYDNAGARLPPDQGLDTEDIGDDSDDGTLFITYDALGRILTARGPDGNTFTYAYDGSGNLSTITSPALGTTTYVFDNRCKYYT